MILGVNHVTLSVPSLSRAIEFYCGLLGFEKITAMSWEANTSMSRTAGQIMGVESTAADAVHLRAPNLVLELFEFREGNPSPQAPDRSVIDHGYTHFCLAVSDLQAEYQRLKSSGMEFIAQPAKVAPGVCSVYGRDPFGNVIELEEAAGRVLPSKSAVEQAKDRISSLVMGVGFVLIFLAFLLWQTPSLWSGPLTEQEIEELAAEMDRNISMEPEEKAEFIERMRSWARDDDGHPVLMLNLMRYRESLGELPPGMEREGTPAEVNEYYEGLVAPLALKQGEYPLIGGDTQAASLTVSDADDANQWERVVIMRAPSRRAFMSFIADPAYGPTVPYKMASSDVAIIPVDEQMVVPDMRWLMGGLLLIIYVLIGWRRARRDLRNAGSGFRPN